MVDNTPLEPVEDEYDEDFDDELIYPSDPALDTIESTMDGLLAAASVDAVYGEPIKQRDTLIIPAAEVLAVAGFGVGSGSGGDEKDGGVGSGGGGGGRAFSRPVAVIVSSSEGVRVEPVLDVTKIALAALTALVFMLGMGARFRRVQRQIERID